MTNAPTPETAEAELRRLGDALAAARTREHAARTLAKNVAVAAVAAGAITEVRAAALTGLDRQTLRVAAGKQSWRPIRDDDYGQAAGA